MKKAPGLVLIIEKQQEVYRAIFGASPNNRQRRQGRSVFNAESRGPSGDARDRAEQ